MTRDSLRTMTEVTQRPFVTRTPREAGAHMAKALDGPESSGPSRCRLPDLRASWPKNNTGIGCVYFLFSSQSLSVLTRGRS
jgi:hypothetical protein